MTISNRGIGEYLLVKKSYTGIDIMNTMPKIIKPNDHR